MGESLSALVWLQRRLQPGLLAWSALYPWVTLVLDQAPGSSFIEHEKHFQDPEIFVPPIPRFGIPFPSV